jgi:hypothetical protein
LFIAENIAWFPFTGVSLLVDHVIVDSHHEREVIKGLIDEDEFRGLLHDVEETLNEREGVNLISSILVESDLLCELGWLPVISRVHHQSVIVLQEGERDLVSEEPVLVALFGQRQSA